MKPRYNRFHSAALLSTGFALSMCFSRAADQTWIDGNESNNWNTTEPNWDAGANWTQTNNAIFGGTGETVTLTEGISAGGLTFNATDYTISGDTLTLNGATPTVTTGTGIAATINSTVAGSAGLTKAGAGTLTLGGTTSYTGGTTVNGGTLTFLNSKSGSSNFAVGAAGTLAFDNTSTLNLNGATLNGSGTLIKKGSGTVQLGANGSPQFISMTGGLIDVQVGTLRNEYGNGYWTANKASLNVAGGATVDLWDSSAGITVDALTGSGTVKHTSYGGTENLTVGINGGGGTFSGTVSDESSHQMALVKSGAGTQVLSGSGIKYIGTTTVNNGRLTLADTTAFVSTPTINSPGVLDLDGSWTLGKSAAGTGGLTKSGNGTVTITTSQNYTGNTAVNGGKLLLQGLLSFPPQAYRYYKFQVNAAQGGGTFQMSELAFYTTGTNPASPGSTRVIPVAYSGGGSWNAGANESPASAYDNNVNTKWYDSASGMPQFVTFDFGSSILMSGYDWATGGDNTPNRNPKDWQVFGSNDNSTWTPIDAQVAQGATPTATKTYANGWTLGNSVSPSLAPGSAISVAASATFGGFGSADAVTVAAGGNIQAGYAGAGTLTLGSLTFSGAGTVSGTPGQAAAPLVVNGALTASGGPASVALAVPGLAAGTYHVIQYGSFGGSISDFTFPGPARNMTLQNNAPYIDVVVTTPTVYPVWTGGTNGGWSYAAASGNWKLSSDSSPTDFMLNDSVLFDDTVGSGNTNITVSTESISAGTITFNNSTKDYTLTQANGKDITAGSLVKTGTGKLTVSGAFTYSGGSTLNGGIVSINNVGSLGTGGRTINGGTLEYTGTTGTLPGSTTLGSSGGTIKVTDLAAVLTQAGSLTPGSSGTLIKDGPGTLVMPLATGTYANPIQIADGTLNLNYGANAAVCSGNITGSASSILRLDGTGADPNNGLTLTGNNTFSGATHLYGRRVFLDSPVGNAISGNIVVKGPTWPSHGLTLLRNEQIADTAVLSFESFIGDYDFRLNGKTETLAGIASLDDTGIVENAGNDGSNDTGIANPGTLIVSGPDSYSFFGGLRNQNGGTNGALQFTKSGTGTQTLSGTGITYTGSTTVNSGTLKLMDATAFASPVTLNGGTLELSRASGTWTFAKTIAAGSGAGNVKVTGFGTVTLSGANTYTGATTIESGTLSVTGSIAGSPLIDVLFGATLGSTTVASGQTVRGTGTLSSVTFASGSTLSPGAVGAIDTILGSGTITLQAGSTCAMQVDRTGGVITNDELSSMSAITYGGTLTVTATGTAFIDGDVIPLFPGATTYGGSFSTVTLPTLSSGLSWDLSGLTVDGSVKVVNYTATPVFNPPAGGYVGPQSVSISSDTGSTIYYTMDGSTPTVASPSGLSPVTNLAVPTNSSVTIKAFARKSGQADSPVATSLYNTLDTPTWITDGYGYWQETVNWQAGVVAQGSGVTADFSTLTLSGFSGVALDGPRTVGCLIFGDQGDLNGWNVDSGNGGTLILDNGGNPPVITVGNHQTTTVNAAATSSNGLLKNGAGTLVLNEANSITGAMTVSQGTLVANKSAALGSAATTVTLGDAATGAGAPGLVIGTGITPAVTLASVTNSNFGTSQTITLNAGSALNGNDAALVTTLNLAGTVPVTLKAANDGGHSTAQDVNWRIAGNGIPAGSTALVLDGTVKALRLNQLSDTSVASSFTGDVLIKGAVTTQGRTYLAQTAENQNLTFLNNNVTVDVGAEWKIVWGGETTGALSGAGTVTLNCQNALNNIGLTVGNNNASGAHSGVIQGGFGLSKVGIGSQSLAGANTYSGATTVNAGTLSVDNVLGSGTGTGAVTVKSGGNLAGAGVISGATTIEAGGTVTAGVAGAGTLTLASVTVAGGIEVKLDTTTCGRLTVTGALTINPGASIHVSTINTPTAAEYIVLTHGTLSGFLPTITPPSGYTVDTATFGVVKLVKIGGSGFSAWADSWAGLTDKTAGGDPDRDGISNLMEYVIGGDPRVSSEQFLPQQTIVGSNLVISYKRSDESEADTTQTGQWSTTLGSWTNIPPVLVNENGSSPDDMTITIPLSNAVNGKLFGRIKVTQP